MSEAASTSDILAAPAIPAIGTMRAAVLAAPQRFEIRRVPRPEPGRGEVRIRIEGCGVCASNVPPWEGRPWFSYPMQAGTPGHEAWGIVDEVGQGVVELSPGDRVSMLSQHGYAAYDVALASQCVRVPAVLADQPAPGEPLGCVMNIFRRAEIRSGHTVAIIGAGFLGLLLTQLCRDAGARVIVVARRPWSLQMARDMGADESVLMQNVDAAIADVARLTNGRGGYEVEGFCDRVIECTGMQEPLQMAGEICRVRGRLIIAGYHQDGLRQVNVQLWNWRGLDVINAHERDPQQYIEGIEDAFISIAAGRLNPAPLYTHVLPLPQINEAMQLATERPEGFVKAIVLMR